MKKKAFFIIGGIIIVILVGIIIYFAMQPQENNLLSITGAEVLEKINNKETFILVRTQNNCSHCESYKPVLNRVLKEFNIVAYNLNTNKLQEEDEKIINEIEKLFSITGTPTTIFINDGVEKTIINRVVGDSSYSNLKKIFKDRGFIN